MAFSRILLLAPLFVACGDDSKGDGTGGTTGTAGTTISSDADGDGYAADEDCNDADAAIHPGAAEVCDGVDNDCDDLIDDSDDSVEGQTSWFTDSDGDGYGDADSASPGCEAPSGTVADDTDCDDSSAAIHPGATEVCDGIDNDCDTLVDSDDDSVDLSSVGTYYSDVDGDGYGDPDSPVEACEPPTDAVANDTDCDDSTADTNPGAAEVEGDRLDNDCDPSTLDNPNGGSFDPTVATMHITAVNASSGMGNDIVVGDYNGDGYADVAMGSAINTVFMHHGPHTTSETIADADATLTGVATRLSYTALASGDIDGDGYDDISAGGPNTYGPFGGAFIQYGPFSGTTDLSASADTILKGLDGDYLGSEVALVTDLTGSGAVDWVVGVYQNDQVQEKAGAVYIFSDAPTGTLDIADAEAVVYGVEYYEGYGAEVTSTDFIGDGVTDLIATSQFRSVDTGPLFVHFGPLSGTYTTGDADLQITTTEEGHGALVKPVGDIDGDGYEDFGSGAIYSDISGTNSGALFIFSGEASPIQASTNDASVTIVGAGEPEEYFGFGLAGLGDYDLNGTDDIIVGSFIGTSSATYGGTVNVFTGPLSGRYSADDAFITIHGSRSSHLAGGLATTPDMDGDGRPELWVGATGFADTVTNQGRIYLFESLNL